MQLRDEHNAVSIVFVDDGKEDKLLDSEKTLLGVYLDLSPGARLALRDSADDDSVVENKERSALKLYKCSDEGGTYKVVEVKTGPLMQEDLNTNVSYFNTSTCLIENFCLYSMSCPYNGLRWGELNVLQCKVSNTKTLVFFALLTACLFWRVNK